MKLPIIVLAFGLLAAAGAASAVAVAASPDASCSLSPKTAVECGMWAVKCIGDALGGNACHGAAAASIAPPDVGGLVECTKSQVRQVANGVTPMPCAVHEQDVAADPGLKETATCAYNSVRNYLNGTPQPCPL